MDTSFVHAGEIFIVFRGGGANMTPGGPQTLWVSSDNGESFRQRSVLPFDPRQLLLGRRGCSTTAKSLSTPTTPI